MKTSLIIILLASIAVLPAGAVAKPDRTDKRAAIAQCKAERGKTKATREAFKTEYRSFSRCVRRNAAEEAAERRSALKTAAKQCKAERRNGKQAYDACVSARARELKGAEDARDAQAVRSFKNAAKECAAERS